MKNLTSDDCWHYWHYMIPRCHPSLWLNQLLGHPKPQQQAALPQRRRWTSTHGRVPRHHRWGHRHRIQQRLSPRNGTTFLSLANNLDYCKNKKMKLVWGWKPKFIRLPMLPTCFCRSNHFTWKPSQKNATKKLTLTSMHWHFRMLQGSCCNILRQAPYHHQRSKEL